MNIDSYHESVQKIFSICTDFSKHLTSLDNELSDLEKSGLLNAHIYYRDGKYLYLVFPQQDGRRDRKYIGADPQKIAEATHSIERKILHDMLTRKRINALRAIDHAYSRLEKALHNLQEVSS